MKNLFSKTSKAKKNAKAISTIPCWNARSGGAIAAIAPP